MIFKGSKVVPRFATLLASAALLAGCAAPSSSIVVGKSRPAIDPAAVKIYIKAPKRYEDVAVIEASSKASWSATEQGKSDVVVRRLKEEAAKLGANGVLLQTVGDQYGGSVSPMTVYPRPIGSPMFGMGFSAPIMNKAGNGLAIFVEEE